MVNILLGTTNLSVSEIYNSVGISDTSYFSKLFRKNISSSPGEYRKLKQKISAGKNYTVEESEKDGIIFAVTVTEYGTDTAGD